jgi:hypothetical protein
LIPVLGGGADTLQLDYLTDPPLPGKQGAVMITNFSASLLFPMADGLGTKVTGSAASAVIFRQVIHDRGGILRRNVGAEHLDHLVDLGLPPRAVQEH